MSDEISRRPSARRTSQPRPPQKAPFAVRFLAWSGVLVLFLCAGYYGSGMFLELLDNKEIVSEKNVVSSTEELQKYLRSVSEGHAAIAPRKDLTIYTLSGDNLVRRPMKIIADVQEDEIMQALSEVFKTSSEPWAALIRPLHVYRDGVTAYVDLPRSFTSGLGTLEESRAVLMISALVRTLIDNFPPLRQVYFLEEGKWVHSVGGIRLSDPWGFE